MRGGGLLLEKDSKKEIDPFWKKESLKEDSGRWK